MGSGSGSGSGFGLGLGLGGEPVPGLGDPAVDCLPVGLPLHARLEGERLARPDEQRLLATRRGRGEAQGKLGLVAHGARLR